MSFKSNAIKVNNLNSVSKSLSERNKRKPEDEDDASKDKEKSLGTKIKDSFFTFLTSSTSHALPRAFQDDLRMYIRIIWFILFVVSTGACSYFIITNILTYLSYSTTTNIEIISESPTQFPSVTICNLNPFNYKRSKGYIDMVIDKNNLTYVRHISPPDLVNITSYELTTEILDLVRSSVASNQNLSSQDRYNMGFTLSDMIVSCFYDNNICNTSLFKMSTTYEYGNCYTFNGYTDDSSTIMTTTKSGQFYGLQMELFVGNSLIDEYYTVNRGIYVVIHNQSITPIYRDEGISASTGFQTNIAISRTFISKLGSPYSSCVDGTSASSYNSELYSTIFNQLNMKTYRQKYCYKLCYQKFIKKDCNCTDVSLPLMNDKTTPCTSSTQLKCASDASERFERSPVTSQCANQCPLECDQFNYQTSIYLSNYPTDYYSSLLQLQPNLLNKFPKNSTNTSQIKDNVVKLNIFYQDLTYTLISDSEEYTIYSLWANIGGYLGLFLGISLLSLTESIIFIIMLIDLMITHCVKACQKRAKVKDSASESKDLKKNNYQLSTNSSRFSKAV